MTRDTQADHYSTGIQSSTYLAALAFSIDRDGPYYTLTAPPAFRRLILSMVAQPSPPAPNPRKQGA